MHSRRRHSPPAVLSAFAGTVWAGAALRVTGVAGGLRATAGGLAAVSGGLRAEGGTVGPRPGLCTDPCGRMMAASSVGPPRVKVKGSACVLRAYGLWEAVPGVHRRLPGRSLRPPLLPLLLLLSEELSSLRQWSEGLHADLAEMCTSPPSAGVGHLDEWLHGQPEGMQSP